MQLSSLITNDEIHQDTWFHHLPANIAERQRGTVLLAPIFGTATPNTIYTQQGSKPACQQCSYWHSYPEHNLHTARLQTRMPATRPHKILAPSIGTATRNIIYTQQGAKPACQQHISTEFSQLPLAQLPRTPFTHSKGAKPACQQHIS